MVRLLAFLLPLIAGSVACSGSAGRGAASAPSHATLASGDAAAPPVAPVAEVSCRVAIAPLTTQWHPPTSSTQTPTATAAFDAARANLSQALIDLCQADAWSPQSRACLSQADSLQAFDRCLAALPALQLAHVNTSSNAIVAATAVSSAAP